MSNEATQQVAEIMTDDDLSDAVSFDGMEDSQEVAEQVESTEQEATEQSTDTTEQTDEATPPPDTPESPESEATETSETPKLDPVLQRIQQRQTTIERSFTAKIDGLSEKLDKALTAITDRGGEPTPKQAEAVQEATDDLDELLNAIKAEDATLGAPIEKAIRSIAGRLSQVKTASPESDKRVAELESRLAQMQQAADIERKAQSAEQSFRRDHPSIASQFDDLCVKAAEAVDAEYPLDQIGGNAELMAERRGALRQVFRSLVSQAEASASVPTPAAEKPKPAKPSTTPPKPTKGATTTATGASAKPVPVSDEVMSDMDLPGSWDA